MLNGARQYGVPVIFTQHIYDWDVMTGAWLRYLAGTRTLDFLRGMPFVSVSDGTVKPDPEEFLPDLRPQPGESILLKMYHDSFSNTNLAEMLRSRNIETIVLTGMAVDSGVGGTARRAAAEGFYSVVVIDATDGGRYQPRYLRAAVDVATTDEVLAAWGASKQKTTS
jgi:nicotinamidase-related amidase